MALPEPLEGWTPKAPAISRLANPGTAGGGLGVGAQMSRTHVTAADPASRKGGVIPVPYGLSSAMCTHVVL